MEHQTLLYEFLVSLQRSGNITTGKRELCCSETRAFTKWNSFTYPRQRTSLYNLIMSAVYDLFKSPKSDVENGGHPVLYARVVTHRTISCSKLVDEMADASSFTQGDLNGMLSTVSQAMVRHLSEGDSVELEGIGFFSPTLKCSGSTERSEISTASVQFANIRFRACSWMKDKMAAMRLQRKGKSPVIAERSIEERLSMVLEFLAKQTIMIRSDYQRLAGCDKTQAIRDLNSWMEAGHIHRYGSGSNIVYLDKKNLD